MPVNKASATTLSKQRIAYEIIPRKTVEDIEENPIALAIWLHLIIKPEDWVISKTEIMNSLKISEHKYKAGMRYLHEKKLVSAEPKRDKQTGQVRGKTLKVNYTAEGVIIDLSGDSPKGCIADSRLCDPLTNTDSKITKTDKGADAPFVPPEGLNLEAWEDYIEYRKEARLRKLQPLSMKKQAKWLVERGGKDIQRDIVDCTIRNQYQGLHPLNGRTKKADKVPDYTHAI